MEFFMQRWKKAIVIWHRRVRKDMLALHWIIASAIKRPGVYWYIYPNYEQARRSVWEGKTQEDYSYIFYITKSLIDKIEKHRQIIRFKNRLIMRFFGSERTDNLRGSGIRGAVFSEFKS